MSLASMMILGSRKQKEDTRWMKEEVGPPWCQALRMIPDKNHHQHYWPIRGFSYWCPTCRSGQHGGRVQGAGGEIVAELVAVIGEVPDLEHEADEEEGQEDDPGAHQAHVEVELEVGLLVLGPGKRDVGKEPCDALVDHVGLEAEGEQAVPEAPEAVTVN